MRGAADLSGWGSAEIIVRVEAEALRLPLRRPVAFSTRRLEARDFTVVVIRTADGGEGVGYSYGGPSITEHVHRNLSPLLVGQPAGAIEHLWQIMYADQLLLARRGAGLRAISAVDIALWDLRARKAGLPLYQLLGGHASAVPAYFSGGYHRDGETLDDVAAEAQRAVDAGFTSAKIKVGKARLTVDFERIRITREVIGRERQLALDANNAWPSAAQALPTIRAMERYDPWWIEEPLSPDDVTGHARLAAEVATPIATGEIEATRWGFLALAQSQAADIWQPDACVAGGVSEWLKIAHLAAALGIPVYPHWNADIHAQLAAVATNCPAIEYFDVNEDVYNFDLVLAEHLVVEKGIARVPARPGAGIELDRAAVARYRLFDPLITSAR